MWQTASIQSPDAHAWDFFKLLFLVKVPVLLLAYCLIKLTASSVGFNYRQRDAVWGVSEAIFI
jgi:hypothetical protein